MLKRVGANKLKKRTAARSPAAIKRAAKKGFSVARVIIIAGLVCAGATAGARSLWQWINTSPRFIVTDIEVKGAFRVDRREIIRLATIREGVRMLDIKPAADERAIMTNCWIRSAKVTRRFPHTVVIAVEERTPVALISAGNVQYLDNEGYLMPLLPATYSDLPLISGLILDKTSAPGKRISAGDMDRVRALFRGADSVNSSIMKHISQIDFSSESMARITLENRGMFVEIDDRKGAVQWRRFQELMDIVDNAPEGMPQRVNLCYSNLGFAQW